MRLARWNWLVLAAFAVGAFILGLASLATGAQASPLLVVIFLFGIVLTVIALLSRRAWLRYLAEHKKSDRHRR
jgi:hypothetical protein